MSAQEIPRKERLIRLKVDCTGTYFYIKWKWGEMYGGVSYTSRLVCTYHGKGAKPGTARMMKPTKPLTQNGVGPLGLRQSGG